MALTRLREGLLVSFTECVYHIILLVVPSNDTQPQTGDFHSTQQINAQNTVLSGTPYFHIRR